MEQMLTGPVVPALLAVICLLIGLWLGRATARGSDPAQAARLAEAEAALIDARTEAARREQQALHQLELLAAAQADRDLLREQGAEFQHRCARADADLATVRADLSAAHRRHDEAEAQHGRFRTETRDAMAKLDLAVTEQQTRASRAEVQVGELRTLLKAELEAGEAKVALLSAVRDDMETKFRQIATDSLRQNGEEMQKTSKERLEAALAPLKQHVDHFQQELKQVHEGALKDRASLKVEIEMLTRRSEEVSREAVALTRALKGDKQKQGAWGEMILSTLLEKSGLRKGEEYLVQEHRVSEEGGRYRPDVVVNMPGGKTLVIDSKVSLIDYEACVNGEDDESCRAARLRHIAALRRHILTLSSKAYDAMEGASVDYVVMFIPIEGALSEALRDSGELTSFALEKNVTIATPTTLMMALRTIANVWTIERRNQNAEKIADRAGKLYDKVFAFTESMEGIGKHLKSARSSYDEAMGRLSEGSGNLLGQVEKLKALGAKTTKSFRLEFDSADDLPEPDEPPAPHDLPAPANLLTLPAKDQPAE